MKFEIETNFNGMSITGDGLKYTFTTKLFSHSSELRDNKSNVVASLSRKSWWKMDFELNIENRTYQLNQRSLETKLVAKDSTIVFNNVSGTSFLNGSKPVTELTSKGLRAKEFSLSINEKNHWLALLMATCIQCNKVTESG